MERGGYRGRGGRGGGYGGEGRGGGRGGGYGYGGEGRGGGRGRGYGGEGRGGGGRGGGRGRGGGYGGEGQGGGGRRGGYGGGYSGQGRGGGRGGGYGGGYGGEGRGGGNKGGGYGVQSRGGWRGNYQHDYQQNQNSNQQQYQDRDQIKQSKGVWNHSGGSSDREQAVEQSMPAPTISDAGSSGNTGGPWRVGAPGVWGAATSETSQPALASPDPPVSGMQALKVSDKLSPPRSPGDKVTPLARPDKGGTSSTRSVSIRVNHFLVKYQQEGTIWHYDVDVKPKTSPKNDRPVRIPKSDLSMIRNKLFTDKPEEFPLSATAYDGEKNIFSANQLETGKFDVEISEGEDTKVRSYTFTINLVNKLELSKLNEYLSGCLLSRPRDILQGMDLVMKENPSREMISVGRNFYPMEPRPEDNLGSGISAYRGFQHSLKPTAQGLALCLDYSVLAFRNRMPVLDFLYEFIHNFDLDQFRKFRSNVESALKGLKVYVNHRKTRQKFVVRGLCKDETRDSSFVVEDPDGQNPPRTVRLVDYFVEKYGKDIQYKDIPCLDLGKGDKRNDVPLEFCEIAEGQRYNKEHLKKDSQIRLKNISLPPPNARKEVILDMVRSKDGPCGGNIASNFGINVEMNMTPVDGRVIEPPVLKLGAPHGNVTTITVEKEKCQWNLVGKLVVEGKSIQRWAVLDVSNSDRRFSLHPIELIEQLMARCEKLGIRMDNHQRYERCSMGMLSDANKLAEVLEGICRQVEGNLQLLLCVMSKRDPGYKHLKWISETKIGIVTQCCLLPPRNKRIDQYVANLALKINAKLGGSNVELNGLPISFGSGHVMFIGADVNHPASGSWNNTSPSIAATVATMNWPAANRYAARVRAQNHRCERILNFGEMCLELLESYVRVNKVRPEKIILFRDGVSESQFDMVLNEELFDLRRTFKRANYSPTVTLIVAQKRHQTRLFPDRKDGVSIGNVPPGTVVDTRVVHPFEFDFYLCSHYGSLGTSKPTHYHVLWDEHRFTSDQLQKLIYDMCFTMARCTKPVSLVPPIYYADLVAYRGRLYYESISEQTSSAGSSSSPWLASSSSSSAASLQDFKLHTDLENEMFFI